MQVKRQTLAFAGGPILNYCLILRSPLNGSCRTVNRLGYPRTFAKTSRGSPKGSPSLKPLGNYSLGSHQVSPAFAKFPPKGSPKLKILEKWLSKVLTRYPQPSRRTPKVPKDAPRAPQGPQRTPKDPQEDPKASPGAPKEPHGPS